MDIANEQYFDKKCRKFILDNEFNYMYYNIEELKFCIEQIFETNKIKFQLLFDKIYQMVKMLIYDDYQYVLKTIKRLSEIGMKFYWYHLFYDCCDEHVWIANNINVFIPIDKLLEYNRYILSFGIEDPNIKLQEPNNNLYPPLFCLIKRCENIPLNGGFNILNFYKIFNFDINEICCNPNYEHCEWYNTMDLPLYLERYVNKKYVYTENDIIMANMDFYIDEKLFASEDGIKYNEYNDNLKKNFGVTYYEFEDDKDLLKILENDKFYFDKIQSKEVNLALCRLIYEINKIYQRY